MAQISTFKNHQVIFPSFSSLWALSLLSALSGYLIFYSSTELSSRVWLPCNLESTQLGSVWTSHSILVSPHCPVWIILHYMLYWGFLVSIDAMLTDSYINPVQTSDHRLICQWALEERTSKAVETSTCIPLTSSSLNLRQIPTSYGTSYNTAYCSCSYCDIRVLREQGQHPADTYIVISDTCHCNGNPIRS